MKPQTDRARFFLHQKRYDQAIAELEKHLLADPSDLEGLVLMSACYAEMKNGEKANFYADKALGVAPENDLVYYYKAIASDLLNNPREAERHIRQAIEIDPFEADYFGFLSAMYIQKKEWSQALAYADQGLEIDPENTLCLNHRTLCLTKLDRHEELQSNIADALKANPYNAYTHANVGWSKLEQGDYAQSRIHFAEALRLNPGLEHARVGMIEAVKAKNVLYRMFLKYAFWMGKLKTQHQWIIILVLFIGARLLGGLSESLPVLFPVYILLIFLFYLSWIIKPLSDFILRLDSFGRYALDDQERRAADITGVGLIAGLLCLLISLLTDNVPYLICALFSLTVIIPLTRQFSGPVRLKKGFMYWYTTALTLTGVSACIWALLNPEKPISVAVLVYLIGFALYTWIANISASRA